MKKLTPKELETEATEKAIKRIRDIKAKIGTDSKSEKITIKLRDKNDPLYKDLESGGKERRH